MRKLAILFGSAAVLAACSTTPPPPPPPPVTVDLNNPLMAPGFLAQAASGDQFEIQSSQLALQVSQNVAVRNFANLLIADHTRMSQAMAGAARSVGLAPPAPVLLPAQQTTLDQLRAAGAGPAFDLAFKNAQIAGHQHALGLMQNYATGSDVPALPTVALEAEPNIQ